MHKGTYFVTNAACCCLLKLFSGFEARAILHNLEQASRRKRRLFYLSYIDKEWDSCVLDPTPETWV